MKCFVVFALSAKSHVPRVLPVVCVGVVCSAIVSRIKDLQQWENVFSATCGFRNHCTKSGYAKSRVTNTRHDALCAWRMLTFRAWESRRTLPIWTAAYRLILQCVESLKNGKCVLKSTWKVLEFLVEKSVQTLYMGWVCWFSTLHWEVFLPVLWFWVDLH